MAQEKQKDSLPEDLPKGVKEKLEKTKKILESFKKKAIKEVENVIGVSLLPPPAPKEGEKPELKKISVLILINDDEVENKGELLDKSLKAVEKLKKDIDENIDPQPMLVSELRQACFDQKYDIINLIAMSAILHDPKDILKALKIAEVHKGMTLKKFDKYIVSYIAMGSLFRGDATSHDIDVAVIVDDTDVKKMSRFELRDKLGAIIRGYGYDAESITGVKKLFHVQVYILTDFWDAVKDAHPVMFTILRDGVPLFDRGVFMPWRLLLKMGKIKPSQEAIDTHMDLGKKLIQRAENKLIGIVAEDIYYSVLNPAQAALMLYGIAPPTPKETVKLLEEVFVKKSRLLDKKYVDILDRIIKMFKDIEHLKIKYVSGKEVDKLMGDAKIFLEGISKLFDKIEKQKEKERVSDLYIYSIQVARDILAEEGVMKVPEDSLINVFKEKLVDTGLMPEVILKQLREIVKAKEDYEAKRLSKHEIEKVRRTTSDFNRVLIGYLQRKRGVELSRSKIQIKYGDKYAEVLLLDKIAFIILDIDAKEREVQKANLTNEGGLKDIKKSSLEELEGHIKGIKLPKHVFIKEKLFEDLKNLFGKDIEILVNL
ncbi:MAG TPA: hypothetical protein VJJ53_01090 [Candidatus Nanoarchaeia archaeon]|nr:hypothetical protein [Candidatus Nanoarchaeia archaeon]